MTRHIDWNENGECRVCGLRKHHEHHTMGTYGGNKVVSVAGTPLRKEVGPLRYELAWVLRWPELPRWNMEWILRDSLVQEAAP